MRPVAAATRSWLGQRTVLRHVLAPPGPRSVRHDLGMEWVVKTRWESAPAESRTASDSQVGRHEPAELEVGGIFTTSNGERCPLPQRGSRGTAGIPSREE